MAARHACIVMLALAVANAMVNGQSTAPTLNENDEAVMQRCATLINSTIDQFGDRESTVSQNPCEWTDSINLDITCSNNTNNIPGTARVTSITWNSAAGDLTDLGLEELDALQSLVITSAAQQIGGGGPTNVSLTLSSEWATKLTSLQSFSYGPGTLKNFDSVFVNGGFLALTDFGILNTILAGNYPAGRLPKAVDGAFPALSSLSIDNCSITEFPSTWGKSGGMLGGLKSLGLGYNEISGSLPEWKSTGSDYWANLSTLDLSYNKMRGSLPASWAESGSFGSLLTLTLDNNSDITGALPSNWAAGLFRLSPSNQAAFENTTEIFLLGLDNTTMDTPYGPIDITVDGVEEGGNIGTSDTLAQYSFSGLGLSGSIPALWSNQSVANAVFKLGLGANATQEAASPQYPHLSIVATGTGLCGALPNNVYLADTAGPGVLQSGPPPTLPPCKSTSARKLML